MQTELNLSSLKPFFVTSYRNNFKYHKTFQILIKNFKLIYGFRLLFYRNVLLIEHPELDINYRYRSDQK